MNPPNISPSAPEPQGNIPSSKGLRSRIVRLGLVLTTCLLAMGLKAQIPSGVYFFSEAEGEGLLHHEVKVAPGYLVYSVYTSNPAGFIKTLGGHYTLEGDSLKLALEFNSAYEQDALKTLTVPLAISGDTLNWGGAEPMALVKTKTLEQPLDGLWLFATRGPDTGQERRGEENSRKTLKFLRDGRFQWIAYDTADMRFSGTGGGHYEAQDGSYTETIEYFSRDNSRVGARLEFQYDLQGNDWHHKGLNSRGEPMYEIWARRDSK